MKRWLGNSPEGRRAFGGRERLARREGQRPPLWDIEPQQRKSDAVEAASPLRGGNTKFWK